MSFKIAARTILQLGAELISSDAVAFYELIKNAFDAGSPRVDIDVVVRIEYEVYISHREHILSIKNKDINKSAGKILFNKIVKNIIKDIDSSAPDTSEIKEEILDADSWDDLIDALDGANYIWIKDTGSGMSLKDLNDIYLTIGTRSRLKNREKQRKRLKNY